MKTITFKIPDWETIKYGWAVLKFKVNRGFDCEYCKNKMFFDTVQLSGDDFLFENTTRYMCIDCTIVDINRNARTIFVTDHVCDWCGNTPTTGFFRSGNIKSNILFGKHWWNGSHICQNCLIDNIEKNRNKQKSCICRTDSKTGKLVHLNSLKLHP